MEVKSNKKAPYIVATFTFEMLVSYIHIQLVGTIRSGAFIRDPMVQNRQSQGTVAL